MKLILDNIWNYIGQLNHLGFTSNSFIRHNGALVMEAGMAKEVADRFPYVPYQIGKKVFHLGEYGIIEVTTTPNAVSNTLGNPFKTVFAFQVKKSWRDFALLNLIEISTNLLIKIAKSNPTEIYGLNFPGIGCGKLKYDDVYKIVKKLPDNVWVFKKGK